ncbi:MAG: thiolase domain-containing protein [Chloroflexota bacterium]|nr:thiolase domain-containing protein [Chloroflexota bacterium]
MRDVSVVGIGQTRVKEHWDKSLRQLATEAVLGAMQDAHVDHADALYVGNMLSGELTGQENLGALIADEVGLRGIEAMKVEAACGGGGAALRVGYLAVASGQFDVVIVAGAEKLTETSNCSTTASLAMAADADYETVHGISFVALNALLMRRYMHDYDLVPEDFAALSMNAHANAANNPYAMFRVPITLEQYQHARHVSDPITVMDSSPVGDGAAALILMPTASLNGNRPRAVKVAASSVATDSLALHARRDPLWLSAVELSSQKAYAQAGVTPKDIDVFEVHDAFSIMSVMSLEAAGFAERGRGAYLAREGEIAPQGKVPISTMGGLKARGHPVGATGVYQAAEAVTQLRGEAGKNQVPDARVAMTQSLGGVAANAVTHIFTN